MTQNTAKLGGTATDVEVGKVAHGLMMMTANPGTPSSDEQRFEAIKAGVDSLPQGAKMMLNSGEFYGPNLSTANLEMLARFFDKYPEYADRTFLSVKGGFKPNELVPDCSPKNIQRSVDTIIEKLRGTKKVDLFQCARVDPKIPIEDTIRTLAVYVEEGKFDHIGVSEVGAATLKRANAVHPITIVEIEVSPWSYEDETKKVIAAAKELNITVAAYSPLGNGFLTGQIQKLDDLKENDFRRHLVRFKEENLKHNLAIVEAISTIAKNKGVTPAQLCIAWVCTLGNNIVPIPGSSHAKRNLENIAAANIILTSKDMAEIDEVLRAHEIQGGRYFEFGNEALNLWA